VLTPGGWLTDTNVVGPPVSENCVAAVNSSTFFFLPGASTLDPRKSFFYNIESSTVAPGPDTLHARVTMACARLRDKSGSSVKLIVAGGLDSADYYALDTSEILDLGLDSSILYFGDL
jgi:hypothetical protein